MKKMTFTLLLLFNTINLAKAQKANIRSLTELINKEDSGWPIVQEWIQQATNKVEVLSKSDRRADNALLQLQVTTRSPMGAIVYETGGILVDDGWIRILGSGNERLNRTIMEWNFEKSFSESGQQPSFLLIADDILGGFFAINAGYFGSEDIGKVFYFSPDNLQWESLGVSYSEFIAFCFSGDLEKFYEGLRWPNWRKEIDNLDGNNGIHCFPYLWTTQGKEISKVSRGVVPIQELWDLYQEHSKL
jgi:hypothetical protein